MIQQLIAAGNLALVDLPPVAKLMSLLVLPFAHEDLAIILGGYIIVNDLMPASLVAVAIYGGIVISDFALYGVGYGARHVPLLRRFADDRVRGFGDTLRRNIFGLVTLCRFVPGVVFVAFIACGWARVSFWRFALASLLISAVYLPLMLYLVIVFGDRLDDTIGIWTWPLLFVIFGGMGYLRRKIFSTVSVGEQITDSASYAICPGMPAVSAGDRKVAAAERIPPAFFYFPMVLNWLRLGIRHRSMTLPTCANPNIFAGGMWGETKSSYLLDVGSEERRWIAPFVLARRQGDRDTLDADTAEALHAMQGAGLEFPLIAKPDIGWHGHGVRILGDRDDLAGYLADFPPDGTVVLQKLVTFPAEAAVLYARLPGEARGRVLSLTLRYFPHVIGNGRDRLRELIKADARANWKSSLHLGDDHTHCGLGAAELDRVPARSEVVRMALIGNQRAGALYRDGRRYITEAMSARFDAISRSMTEFHYGRFDIRFDSIDALMRGEDFRIVEINGIGGEAIDVWDPRLPVREVYRRLFDQQELLFVIGGRNRRRGFSPTPAGEFVTSLARQSLLISRYPASS